MFNRAARISVEQQQNIFDMSGNDLDIFNQYGNFRYLDCRSVNRSNQWRFEAWNEFDNYDYRSVNRGTGDFSYQITEECH